MINRVFLYVNADVRIVGPDGGLFEEEMAASHRNYRCISTLYIQTGKASFRGIAPHGRPAQLETANIVHILIDIMHQNLLIIAAETGVGNLVLIALQASLVLQHTQQRVLEIGWIIERCILHLHLRLAHIHLIVVEGSLHLTAETSTIPLHRTFRAFPHLSPRIVTAGSLQNLHTVASSAAHQVDILILEIGRIVKSQRLGIAVGCPPHIGRLVQHITGENSRIIIHNMVKFRQILIQMILNGLQPRTVTVGQSTIDEGIESVFQGFEMRKETQVLAQHKVSCLNKHLLKLNRHGRTIPKLVKFGHKGFGLLLAFFRCGSGKCTHLLLGERGIVGKGFEPLRRKRENGQQNNKEQQYSFTIHQVIVLFINDLCQI